MSARKAEYPSKSPPRHLRPKKPNKGQGRPSSHKGARKSKTWMSLGDAGRFVFPWWKSPMMKEERLSAAANRKG